MRPTQQKVIAAVAALQEQMHGAQLHIDALVQRDNHRNVEGAVRHRELLRQTYVLGHVKLEHLQAILALIEVSAIPVTGLPK